MKKLLAGVAALGFAAVVTSSIEVSAAPADGVSTPSVPSAVIIAHGEHYNCMQGPRGWWHLNSQITGLPRWCLFGRS